MLQTELNGCWSDQVNDSNSSTKNSKADYAINWGEKVKVSALPLLLASTAAFLLLDLQITDDLIAQICPADLVNQVCDFDYVMPNGCDHNCEMLRLCEVNLK
jgi:hypothetical protein